MPKIATYIEIYDLSSSTNLTSRTSVAVANAAKNVLLEDPSTPNHVNRVAWAREAIRNAPLAQQNMLWAVLTDPTIQNNGESATDVDIQNVVNDSINLFALG